MPVKTLLPSYYRFLDVGLIIMNLEARFFAAAFFSAAKKILASIHFITLCTRVVFYYNKIRENLFSDLFFWSEKNCSLIKQQK